MRTAMTAGALSALALTSAFTCRPAFAEPNDYIVSPIVEEGERAIELKTGQSQLAGGGRSGKASLALGYAPTAWWGAELYASWHGGAGEKNSFDAWEIENRFQLTDAGRYPLDLGLLVEIERPLNRAEGYKLRWGPLLQAELGSSWLANLNLLLGKAYRAESPAPAALSYQWQLKYRAAAVFEPALQGFGELGAWTDWAPQSQQAHSAGPAALGRIDVGSHRAFKYDVGLQFGLNHASARRTWRTKLEYEF